MKIITIILLILNSLTLGANEYSFENRVLADSTVMDTLLQNNFDIHSSIENVFQPLDKSEISSGILIDKYLWMMDSLPFGGAIQGSNDTLDADDFKVLKWSTFAVNEEYTQAKIKVNCDCLWREVELEGYRFIRVLTLSQQKLTITVNKKTQSFTPILTEEFKIIEELPNQISREVLYSLSRESRQAYKN